MSEQDLWGHRQLYVLLNDLFVTRVTVAIKDVIISRSIMNVIWA